MKVALVLYPGFTALDVVGPFQVLAAAPGVETVLVARELGSIPDVTACCPLPATATFCDVPVPEVVVVPGSELSLDLDPMVVDWLSRAHATTSWTTSSAPVRPAAAVRRGIPRRGTPQISDLGRSHYAQRV
jgi:putative intracellular protease/amidase